MSSQRLFLCIALSAVAGALATTTLTARAQAPAQAECMLFAGSNMGASKEKDRPMQIVNAKNSADVVGGWMNEQLAAGRTRFHSTSMFTNGSVVCAW